MKDADFALDASFCLKGKEGLEQLEGIRLKNDPENLPDVIFLDINMPMMNAWEFLKEYQELQPNFGKKGSFVYSFFLRLSKRY